MPGKGEHQSQGTYIPSYFIPSIEEKTNALINPRQPSQLHFFFLFLADRGQRKAFPHFSPDTKLLGNDNSEEGAREQNEVEEERGRKGRRVVRCEYQVVEYERQRKVEDESRSANEVIEVIYAAPQKKKNVLDSTFAFYNWETSCGRTLRCKRPASKRR